MAVSITPDRDTLRLGQPTPLFDLRAPGPGGATEVYRGGANGGAGYDSLPDGKRFVMVRGADPPGGPEILELPRERIALLQMRRSSLGELQRLWSWRPLEPWFLRA